MIDPENPVTDAVEFVGQRSTVRRIFSRIGAERPQSVAIIGGRKTGKTSLFNFLLSPGTQEENLTSPGQYIIRGFSALRSDSADPDAFLAEVSDALGIREAALESQYNSLQRKVEDLHKAGKKIVLLFDDFHRITSNKRFPLEFFSFLRSLANNYNLAYVTSSYLELQKLCVAKDIEESPFFNIFTNIALGLLARQEAVSLLARCAGWEEERAGRVVDWCGPSPYLVKLIARQCAGNCQENNFEKQFLPIFQDYFAQILAVVPREGYKPLKDLVKGRQPDPGEAHLLRPLVRHRFLDEDEEKLSFFSEAFKVFIARHASADMLKGAENFSR